MTAAAERGHTVLVFGPPGTGKTSWISQRVRDTARARGSEKIMVTSFTKTAALEVKGRDLPIPPKMVGTLHSMAYRAIDSPTLYVERIREWNESHPQWAIQADKGSTSLEEAPAEWFGASEGAKVLGEVDIMRARMVPPEQWPSTQWRGFYEAWTKWKNEAGVIDFTDMLEMALADVSHAPGKPEVIFADEQQDSTPLELALLMKWGEQADRIVFAGDDDQCGRGDALVLTADHGEVPMDQLDPAVHRLVSCDLSKGYVTGWKSGFAFEVASRPYRGEMVEVTTAGRTTVCTPDHRWWVQADRSRDHFFTYLMRSGDRWRVGWCQATKSDGNAHLGTRARLEGADSAWVLASFPTREQASIHESITAARYGLPLNLFKGREHRHGYASQEALDAIFAGLDPAVQAERAIRCLNDHGRRVQHPFWAPGAASKHGRRTVQVRACNLIAGYHRVPTPGGEDRRAYTWEPVSVSRSWHFGSVFSINVEPHHTYIADGMVTANCLYRFRGANAEALVDLPVPDSDRIILDQSYRVPEKVLISADRWVHTLTRRQEKLYRPRDAEGSVSTSGVSFASPDIVREIRARLDDGKSVMALASCGYMLDKLKGNLRQAGLPFWNPYRPARGDWNPLHMGSARSMSARQRLLAYLVMDEDAFGDRSRLWTGGDVKAWSHFVKATGVFRRGAKGAIEGLPDRELSYEEVAQLFADEDVLERAVEPSLEWYASHLTAQGSKSLEFPIEVYRQLGPEGLTEDPRVMIGTIHSFKGAQADTVLLCPDLSFAGKREWDNLGEQRDSVVRLFYVAMTRAREELVFCAPSANLAIDFQGYLP